MNKNKYLVGIFLISSVFMGASLYVRDTVIKHEEMIYQSVLKKTENNPSISINKTNLMSGLFSTNGTYNVGLTFKNENLNSNITINYEIQHGIWNWILFKELPIKATAKINGSVSEYLKIEQKPVEYKGIIFTTGKFEMTSLTSDISFIIPKPENTSEEQEIKNEKTGMLVKLNNFTNSIKLNKESGELDLQINIKELFAKDLEDEEDNITIEELKTKYSSNIQDISLGFLDFEIKKATDSLGNLKANEFKLQTGVTKKDDEYSIVFSTKIENLDLVDQQNSSFELAYSINKINKNMMQLYKQISSNYAIGAEISNDDINSAKQIIVDNLMNGFNFNIEKFKYKNESSMISLDGQVEIIPTVEKIDSFNLAKKTKFNLHVLTEGELSEMINTMFVNSLESDTQTKDPNPEIEKPNFIDNKFNLSIKYDNNLLTVNNFPAPTMVNYFIFNWLSSINKSLGFDTVQINENSSPEEIYKGMESELKMGTQKH